MAIQDLDDLIKQLRQHPEWRDALRREILTEELLSLPQIVRELAVQVGKLAEVQQRTEQRLETLGEAQQRTEQRLETLAEAQQRTEERLESLTEHVEGLAEAQRRTEYKLGELADAQRHSEEHLEVISKQVAKLRGDNLERRYREHAGAFFGSLLRRAHALLDKEFTALVEDALDAGTLNDEERDDLLLSDVVVHGRDHHTREEIYLLVEVSVGVGEKDVERAARRAALLSRLSPTRATVAGEWINAEAVARCRELDVWQLLDGPAIAPTAS